MNNLVARVWASTQDLTRPAVAQNRLGTLKPHGPFNLFAVTAAVILHNRLLRPVAEKRAVFDILGPISTFCTYPTNKEQTHHLPTTNESSVSGPAFSENALCTGSFRR